MIGGDARPDFLPINENTCLPVINYSSVSTTCILCTI